ncbi:MAG: sulfide/dihydroorotate dehydrogenase-like FAD/NAD-binding protein [Deltaproteobacteria bacterium]|nr:sulfide/dihydroorotate dehydrogenase-like FAD/NAD-binding protein [Deltaproteobacteria bacterium]
MNNVIERRMIAPNVHELVVEAPEVARGAAPGQFVIVRPFEGGERIPISISDWDRDQGTVTCVFIEVGASTMMLAGLCKGDVIPTFAGPLGRATDLSAVGPGATVVAVGGCYGIGSIFPLVRAVRQAGASVHVVIEARSSYLFYWTDKLRKVATSLNLITRDGSRGRMGHIDQLPDILRERLADKGGKPDKIYVNGCTYLMKRATEVAVGMGLGTTVNLNPLMIDGTGMCGVCRVSVGGRTRFACVDGPDFPGEEVNWKELFLRRKAYAKEEKLGLLTVRQNVEHPGGKCAGAGRTSDAADRE